MRANAALQSAGRWPIAIPGLRPGLRNGRPFGPPVLARTRLCLKDQPPRRGTKPGRGPPAARDGGSMEAWDQAQTARLALVPVHATDTPQAEGASPTGIEIRPGSPTYPAPVGRAYSRAMPTPGSGSRVRSPHQIWVGEGLVPISMAVGARARPHFSPECGGRGCARRASWMGSRGWRTAAGQAVFRWLMRKMAPRGWLGRHSMSQPWARTICCTTARPSPVPPWLVVK